jgi:putative addiction module component (TIGR02574 family)
MVNTYDEIFDAALSLSPGLRAMLAEHLFKSLDSQNQAEIDAIWAEEVEKRFTTVEKGEITPIPAEQVFQELRSRNQ